MDSESGPRISATSIVSVKATVISIRLAVQALKYQIKLIGKSETNSSIRIATEKAIKELSNENDFKKD